MPEADTPLPADFDWSVLDSVSYKEDAVREDLIAPVLRKAGYKPSGATRMERSKSLVHPFVKIGSKQHNIYIIPDYTLIQDDKPLMVVEAKAPNEAVVQSVHVEQAYSYAIHQDIKCRHFSLCNGRDWAFYDVHAFAPLLVVPCKEINSRWEEVEKQLLPKYLSTPELRDFQPDLGWQLLKMGVQDGETIRYAGNAIQLLAKARDGLHALYTCCVTWNLEGTVCMASFDLSPDIFMEVINSIPKPQAEQILEAVSGTPYQIDLDCKIVTTWDAHLGDVYDGPHEDFIPLVVTKIQKVVYAPQNTAGWVDPRAVQAGVKLLRA